MVVSVSVIATGVALAAALEPIRRSRATTAFERFHRDLLALRKRAHDDTVILRVCPAPVCARSAPLGVTSPALIVEQVSSCAPATPAVQARFTVLSYGNDVFAAPDGSADGVCVFPDGHITGFDGSTLTPPSWTGFAMRLGAFSTRILVDPATGVILGANGDFALPFVDNLADRSVHGAPAP